MVRDERCRNTTSAARLAAKYGRWLDVGSATTPASMRSSVSTASTPYKRTLPTPTSLFASSHAFSHARGLLRTVERQQKWPRAKRCARRSKVRRNDARESQSSASAAVLAPFNLASRDPPPTPLAPPIPLSPPPFQPSPARALASPLLSVLHEAASSRARSAAASLPLLSSRAFKGQLGACGSTVSPAGALRAPRVARAPGSSGSSARTHPRDERRAGRLLELAGTSTGRDSDATEHGSRRGTQRRGRRSGKGQGSGAELTP